MKCSAPRFLFTCLVVVCSLPACNKGYIPVPNPVDQHIIYLTGNAGAYSQWKLNNLLIGNTSQTMTPPYTDYAITYKLNGSFQDSDGMKGTWTMVNKDSLFQKVTNAATGVYAVQGYHIVNLTATEMVLSYMANNKQVNASYIAER